MGIDIYAKWDGMTTQEEDAAQITGFSIEHGHVGYLREAYHGEPYATKALVPEAFRYGRARIAAAELQKRLRDVLHIVETREQSYAFSAADEAVIERMQRRYLDFVALCARKEQECGIPCMIVASR